MTICPRCGFEQGGVLCSEVQRCVDARAAEQVPGWPFELVDGECPFCGEVVTATEFDTNEGFCPSCDNILDGQPPE